MEIRKAQKEDLNLLVKVRLDFLEAQRPLSPMAKANLQTRLEAYYAARLGTNDFAALLGFEGDEVAVTGFLVFSEYPPSDLVPASRRAMVSNVFTYPAHRRKGHAERMVAAMLELAQAEGAAIVDLYATPDAEKLYQKMGFSDHGERAMRIHLISGEVLEAEGG